MQPLSNRQTSLHSCFSTWRWAAVAPRRALLYQTSSKEELAEPLDCKNQEGLHWQTAHPLTRTGVDFFSRFLLLLFRPYMVTRLYPVALLSPNPPSFEKKNQKKTQNNLPHSSISIASSLVGEDAKTKFLSKMGQLTTSSAMLANVFQRKKWARRWPPHGTDGPHRASEPTSGTFSLVVPLNVDENRAALIPWTEMKVALTDFHFRAFLCAGGRLPLAAERRWFLGWLQESFFTDLGKRRRESAEDDTGQYLDSPKKEKEGLVLFLFFDFLWTWTHHRINLIRVQYFLCENMSQPASLM